MNREEIKRLEQLAAKGDKEAARKLELLRSHMERMSGELIITDDDEAEEPDSE